MKQISSLCRNGSFITLSTRIRHTFRHWCLTCTLISYSHLCLALISHSPYSFPFSHPLATQPNRGPRPPHSWGFYITHNDTPQSLALFWTKDRPVAETSSTQHSKETDIHASGGIRTRNPSKRSAADAHLRQFGHWDRHSVYFTRTKYSVRYVTAPAVLKCLIW
jgi:hypothetical protein